MWCQGLNEADLNGAGSSVSDLLSAFQDHIKKSSVMGGNDGASALELTPSDTPCRRRQPPQRREGGHPRQGIRHHEKVRAPLARKPGHWGTNGSMQHVMLRRLSQTRTASRIWSGACCSEAEKALDKESPNLVALEVGSLVQDEAGEQLV